MFKVSFYALLAIYWGPVVIGEEENSTWREPTTFDRLIGKINSLKSESNAPISIW